MHGGLAAAAEAATLRWVDEIVVGMSLCPFAAGVRAKRRQIAGRATPAALRCVVSMAGDVEGLVAAAEEEMRLLARGMDTPSEGDSLPESTLLVLPAGGEKGFLSEYRELVHASWEVQARLNALGLVGRLQQVLFHPRAVPSLYEESESGGAKAFASRSPFPTLHFLREEDVMRALTSGYKEPELIPQKNASKLEGIGEEKLRAVWASLLHTGSAAKTA